MNRKRWIILITLILGIMVSCLLSIEVQAGIILKTMVVNPSKIKTQQAVLKAYLPKEAKPEDVVELGDLKIDYDIEKALYFVYKKVELEPGESVARSIEIKDIWLISQAEIDSLTGRAKELVEALKKTAYFDTAVTLQEDIDKKSVEISTVQEKAMNAIPQTHIAVYRENMKSLDSINTVLAKLESMFIESRISKGVGDRVSVKTTWWIIFGVIIALGVISFVFFVIWQRQAGIAALEQKTKESSQGKE